MEDYIVTTFGNKHLCTLAIGPRQDVASLLGKERQAQVGGALFVLSLESSLQSLRVAKDIAFMALATGLMDYTVFTMLHSRLKELSKEVSNAGITS